MDKTKELFARNIYTLRERLGLRQDQVAEAIGVNVRTYQKYEYGLVYPRPSKLEALATVLQTSPSDLLASISPEYGAMLKRLDSNRATVVLELHDLIRDMSLDDLETLKFTAKGLLSQSNTARSKSSKGS